MRGLTIAALVLVIIGAINWGFVGFFGFSLIGVIFGYSPAGVIVQRIIYALVGLAGLYGISIISRLASSRDDVCVPGHVTPITQM